MTTTPRRIAGQTRSQVPEKQVITIEFGMVTFREDNACKSKVGRNFLQSNPCKRMAAGELVHLKIVQAYNSSRYPTRKFTQGKPCGWRRDEIGTKETTIPRRITPRAAYRAPEKRCTMHYIGTVAFRGDGATKHGAPEAVVGVIGVVGR
ncbi:hypothetical protein R3P38DRAFT_2765611 [Favolaschia claudopus]|uniref:Uncharacterized protein n=1 Tax=Favolaschia claudopus TaxID=2862362 RepID=A0AAW0D710_9AGAR